MDIKKNFYQIMDINLIFIVKYRLNQERGGFTLPPVGRPPQEQPDGNLGKAQDLGGGTGSPARITHWISSETNPIVMGRRAPDRTTTSWIVNVAHDPA